MRGVPTVGVQLVLQDGAFSVLRERALEVEELGVDTLYVSDHFFAVRGTGDGATFESMTTLAALAAVTHRVRLGPLVASSSFRNPNLLADMARTIDHISSGRAVLGIGAGNSERDHEAYGYAFGTEASRLRELERNIRVIRERWRRLTPPPVHPIPLLIGGGGERVLLRLAAEHANIWHGSGDAEMFARKSAILDEWCAKVGRDPREIQRAAFVANHLDSAIRDPGPYLAAGCGHLIVSVAGPAWELGTLAELLAWRRRRQ